MLARERGRDVKHTGEEGSQELPRPLSSLELASRRTCSVDEAAAVLGIGRSTAYAAAHDGSLPVLRVRTRLLVPTAKLLAMLGCDDANDQAR
jgi:excisionase family DNA binding protein